MEIIVALNLWSESTLDDLAAEFAALAKRMSDVVLNSNDAGTKLGQAREDLREGFLSASHTMSELKKLVGRSNRLEEEEDNETQLVGKKK